MSRARFGENSAYGGFSIGVGGLCASDVILLAQAYFSVPGVMTGALMRPARHRSLLAILLHAFLIKLFRPFRHKRCLVWACS